MSRQNLREAPIRRTHEQVGGPEFTFGMELIMDLQACDPRAIRSKKLLQEFTKKLVKKIKMKRYGKPWIKHFGHANPITSGYTVIQPIETSSIVLHLGEGDDSAHINIHSCQNYDWKKAMRFAEKFFKNKKTIYTVLYR